MDIETLDPSEQEGLKGLENEIRVVCLACSLQDDFNLISVTQTGDKLDSNQIDIVITLLDPRSRVISIPVQSKSSYKYAEEFNVRHPEFVEQGGIVIISNQYRTDDEMYEELKAKILRIFKKNFTFKDFFDARKRKKYEKYRVETRKLHKSKINGILYKKRRRVWL